MAIVASAVTVMGIAQVMHRDHKRNLEATDDVEPLRELCRFQMVVAEMHMQHIQIGGRGTQATWVPKGIRPPARSPVGFDRYAGRGPNRVNVGMAGGNARQSDGDRPL